MLQRPTERSPTQSPPAPLLRGCPLGRGDWRGFGEQLSPDHLRREDTRLVSYYALFKGMAASKPTS